MADSALERIKQLDEERTQLVAAAKKEAVDRANAAIAALNALGFNYRLAESGRAPRQPSRQGTRTVKDASCPVCEFRTAPPHDARRHRGQGKRKRAFTEAELKNMGLQRA